MSDCGSLGGANGAHVGLGPAGESQGGGRRGRGQGGFGPESADANGSSLSGVRAVG